MLPAMSHLSSRAKQPDAVDQAKLHQMMLCLKNHPKDTLNLIATSVDTAFAVHNDCESHAGVMATLGKGAFHNELSKQKLNTRRLTQAKLVTADEAMSSVLWTKWFCKQQGCPVTSNVLQQDNQASIKLEEN